MKFPTSLPKRVRKVYKDLKAIEEKRKTGFRIVVDGPKNSGKSTLINAFGIQRHNIFNEANAINKSSADLVITVIPADLPLCLPVGKGGRHDKELDDEGLYYLKKAKTANSLLVINKIDKAKKLDELLLKIEDAGIDFNNVIPVSALERTGIEDLKKKISDFVGTEKIALAYQVPSFTSLAVESAAKATAKQNALISAVSFLPGADMPILTVNQIKMIFEIGAAYGVDLDFQRAKEILAVVAAGYGLRGIARQLLDFAPGPGWIVKGIVAYSGTVTIAKAADIYFSKVVGEGEESLAPSRTAAS